MSYLPAEIPGPEPLFDDEGFWAACQERRLCFQHCTACGHFRHPPRPVCPKCKSFKFQWTEAADEGELFSFTVVHHGAHPAIGPALPYNIAIVRYPSFDDVRVISNVVDVAPEDLRIGMPLGLLWERCGNGMLVPRYKRRE